MAKARTDILIAAIIGAVCGGAGLSMVAASPAIQTIEPETTSYAIGYDLGLTTAERLKLDAVKVEPGALVQGFEDAITGADPAYDESELDAKLAVLHREVTSRIAKQLMNDDPVFRALAGRNEQASRDFIETIASKDDSVRLPGGVVYQVKSEGSGEIPALTDVVKLSFRARLRDGTLVGDEQEIEMRLDGMIVGAQEAISEMSVGSRWIVAIPPEKAFGLGGRDPDIGPNEAILADVELLGIQK
ncbi:MAG: hypothetical protein F6K11_21905 [Leptolyngbya sp. SIO3F4]|nr:hypothetical protein [Leptolyngbya sp. SIO3F4]